LDIEIPKDKLIVMTGLSGSGKSSLAFDTIYAEGQRRSIEIAGDKPSIVSTSGLSI
jgi:excinuclease UvrABC ATPase subunit